MISITALVPAYYGENTILQLLEKVTAVKVKGIRLEVIVVDDGSPDSTLVLLEKKPGLYKKLIKRGVNGGEGAANKAGLIATSGDYILFQDTDLEYNPADYPKLFSTAVDQQADVVIGSRFMAPQSIRISYFWNKVGNFLITFIFNILHNTTFTDINSCYLMYRRDLVDPNSLVTSGWEQKAEILSIAIRGQKVQYEVPITYHGRTYGAGKKVRAYHAITVIWTMFRMRFSG